MLYPVFCIFEKACSIFTKGFASVPTAVAGVLSEFTYNVRLSGIIIFTIDGPVGPV